MEVIDNLRPRTYLLMFRGKRIMLMYADSSDEDELDRDEIDSEAGQSDEVFSMQTNVGPRHDSLREIVRLKDATAGSQSFKVK